MSTSVTDDAAELAALGTSTVARGRWAGLLARLTAASIWRGARLAGPAFTVKMRAGDNPGVQRGVRTAPVGSVLVVDTDGLEFGYFGEILDPIAVVRGVAGMVIDETISDVDKIRAFGFPIFATGVFMRHASKADEGILGERATPGNRSVDTGAGVIPLVTADTVS